MPRCELSRLKKESVSAGELLMKNLEKLDQISIPLNSQVNQLGSIPFLNWIHFDAVPDPGSVMQKGIHFDAKPHQFPSHKIGSILNAVLGPRSPMGNYSLVLFSCRN